MAEYLVKFVARSGAASRRGAEELIRSGRVSVNDRIVTDPSARVDPELDHVVCGGRVLREVRESEKVYILLHKPRGFTTSHRDAHAEKLAVSLIDLPVAGKLVSAGRLDRDSEGLLIFSNDGDFIQLLSHPRCAPAKRYRVTADRPLSPAQCRRMTEGISDRGELLKADAVTPEKAPCTYRIILHQGRKREIRRMLHACGAATLRLERLAVGPVELGALAPGQWRKLRPEEVDALRDAAKKRDDAPPVSGRGETAPKPE